jgi:hypothetical protein
MTHAMNIRRLIDLVTPREQPISLLREYLEQHSYAILMEDQRTEYLIKTYGTVVANKFVAVKDHTPDNILASVEHQHGEDDAHRVIEYIATFDPSPNRQYAQWLVIRWLKNGFQLEDLARAKEYLEYFHRFKSRLEKKDINAYPNLPDLYNAIASLLQQAEEPVSARDEKRQLANRMSKPPEANVLHNDDEIRVVHPLTQEASCYWGQNTQWCTAAVNNNYFHSYNDRAPLYIILFKATNKRFQFQFDGSPGGSDSFMDERDSPIQIGPFVREHPILLKIFGERKFIPYIQQIGIGLFSPEATKMMSARQLQSSIHSMADLRLVDPSVVKHIDPQKLGNLPMATEDLAEIPESAKQDLAFQKGLVQPVKNETTGELVPRVHMLALLPEDYYKDHLATLISWFFDVMFAVPEHLLTEPVLERVVGQTPNCFKKFKDEWRTSDLAHATVDGIMAKTGPRFGYAQVIEIIPPEWRDEYVMQKYWVARAANDNSVHLSNIPHAFWNESTITKALSNHPDDMKEHLGVLTEGIVAAVMNSKQFGEHFMKMVPPNFMTKHLMDAMDAYDDSKINAYSGNREQQILQARRSRQSVYRLFPATLWNLATTIDNMREVNSVDEINPELLRDEDVIEKFLLLHPSVADSVDGKYITPGVVTNLLRISSSQVKPLIVGLAARKLVSQQALVAAPEKPPTYDRHAIYKNVPDDLRSLPVARAYAEQGLVPLDQLPESLQTEPMILKRLNVWPQDFANMPTKFRTPEFALKMAETNSHNINHIPEDMLSEPLLHFMLDYDVHSAAYHEARDDHDKAGVAKANFKKFPKSTWSERNVIRAVAEGFIPADLSWYEKYPTPEMATALVRQSPDMMKLLPKGAVSKTVIAGAANVQPSIILMVDPADITEAMAYEALKRNIGKLQEHKRNSWQNQNEWAIFEHIPKAIYSKRIYKLLVNGIVPLKDVPKKLRDDETCQIAVQHDPRNVLAINGPVAWMNKHFASPHYSNEQWMIRAEKAGLVHTKKTGWVDVREFDREQLETGYSVAISRKKVNLRMYVFSPKGMLVAFLYSEKDKVHFPYNLSDADGKKLQPTMLEIANKYLDYFDDLTDLNKLYLYKTQSGRVIPESKLSKKTFEKIQYTSVHHLGNRRLKVFVREKPIIVFSTEYRKDMYGKSSRSQIDIEEIIDYPRVMENGNDIAALVKKEYAGDALGHAFENIGIDRLRNSEYKDFLAVNKLGRVGDLVVYTTNAPVRISIFDLGKQQLAATAKLKKDGTDVYEVQGHGRYSTVSEPLEALMHKVGQYVGQKEKVIGVSPFDKP